MALSRNQVVEAALAVADAEELQALGIRRVARELGVTPMALYRYVESKNELLDLVRESLWSRLGLQRRGRATWTSELREIGRAFRRLVHEHPAAPALLAGGSGEGEAERRICDAMLGSFRKAGFDARTAELLYLQFSHFVLALVRLDAADEGGFELGLDVFLGGADRLRRTRR